MPPRRRKEDDEAPPNKKKRIEAEEDDEEVEAVESEEHDDVTELEEGKAMTASELVQFPQKRGAACALPVRRASLPAPEAMSIKEALAMRERPKHACVRVVVEPVAPSFPLIRGLCGFCKKPVQGEQYWEYPGPGEEQKIKCCGVWNKRENKYTNHHTNTASTLKTHPMGRAFVLQRCVLSVLKLCFVLFTQHDGVCVGLP